MKTFDNIKQRFRNYSKKRLKYAYYTKNIDYYGTLKRTEINPYAL